MTNGPGTATATNDSGSAGTQVNVPTISVPRGMAEGQLTIGNTGNLANTPQAAVHRAQWDTPNLVGAPVTLAAPLPLQTQNAAPSVTLAPAAPSTVLSPMAPRQLSPILSPADTRSLLARNGIV